MADTTQPGLLLAVTDLDPAHEAAVNRWYDQRHVPQRQGLPGFLTACRYVAVSGGPKYAALYDLESPEAVKTEAYKSLVQPPVWTEEDADMLKCFQNNLRGVMVQVFQAGASTDVAQAVQLVGLEPEPGYDEEYNAWYNEEHIPYIIKVPGVLRVRRFKAVEGAPSYLTVWELADPSVRQTPAYQAAAETPWTFRMRKHCNRRFTGMYQHLTKTP